MKTGNQEPTFSAIGSYAYSNGAEVVEMFEEDGGATFYPSQKSELELMLARNADGSPAAQSLGISKPRQNGKSYAARYYAVYMSDFEHRNVMYSAHHSTTTNKMFRAMCDLFESPERFPEFSQDVKNVSHVRGYEAIYFKDWIDDDGKVQKGGSIEFVTRTNSGSRGGTYSVIIIDEAQELTTDQQEGLLPVISASADIQDNSMLPQQIYIGTPPGPTCKGTVFANMHSAAHENRNSATWWLEWAIDTKSLEGYIPDADKAVELAYQTNPAMGYRIAEKTVINEYENMSADGFARERLGWWSPVLTKKEDTAINAEQWKACASNEPKPEGKTAYGVKFSADGAEICLAGAVIPEEGAARISLIMVKPTSRGTQWLADWLNERYKKAACVAIDGRNGADVLVDKIKPVWKVQSSIIRPSAKDVVTAAGTLSDALAEQSVTWYKPQAALNESALTAVKRPIGGGWGFGGPSSTPIEAAALALWAAKTTRRNPQKKMRIG